MISRNISIENLILNEFITTIKIGNKKANESNISNAKNIRFRTFDFNQLSTSLFWVILSWVSAISATIRKNTTAFA